MKFCILSPIAGLQKYSARSHYHLILPQIKDPAYIDFYQQMRRRNDYLILDNGAWEGSSDWDQLAWGIVTYEPDMVVLPDYLLQHWTKTWMAALDFLDTYYDQFPKVTWGYVPQSEPGDILGWVEGLRKALQDPRIRLICLPRALATDITHDPLMRANVCRGIKTGWGKKVHALGMVDGNVVEVSQLRRAGCDSIDSNSPVWRGWNGFSCKYHSSNRPWPNLPVDYTALPPSAENDSQIMRNLEDCNAAAGAGF